MSLNLDISVTGEAAIKAATSSLSAMDAQQAKNLATLISTAKEWKKAGEDATSYAASIGRLIKETDKFVEGAAKLSSWATKQRAEFMTLTAALKMFDRGVEEANSGMRISLAAKKADSQAVEKQAIAFYKAKAALDNFNAAQYAGTVQARIDLAEKKKNIDLAEKKASVIRSEQAALELLRAKQSALTAEEKQELATLQTLESLTKQRNTLLARQSKELAPLIAEIKALTAAERQSEAAATGFNLRMHLGNQITASSRAALYGLGASFGMYTSSTIVAAAASYAFFSALRSGLAVGVTYEAALAKLGTMSSTFSKGSKEYAQDLQQLHQAAISASQNSQFSMTQAAEAMTELALAGLNAKQSAKALPAVLGLAAIGVMDTAEATEIATNVMMGFGLQVEDLGRVTDVLARAATDSNSSVKDIGMSMSYVAPVANAFGVDLEFTAAAIEVLANAGIKGSRAGTGLRKVFLELFAPSKRAQEAMELWGLSVGKAADEAQDLEQIGAGAGKLFEGAEYSTDAAIEKLREFSVVTAGGTRNLELIREAVGIYAAPAMIQLVRSLDMGKKGVLELQDKLYEAGGSTEAAMLKIQDNVQTAFEMLKNAAGRTALVVFDSEKSGLRQMISDMTVWLRVMERNPQQIAAVVAALKQFASMVWGVIQAVVVFKGAMLGLAIIKGTITTIGVMATAMQGLAVSMGLATASATAQQSAFALFAARMGGVGAALGWIAAAAVAAAAGVYLVGEKLLGLGSTAAKTLKVYQELSDTFKNDQADSIAKNNALMDGGLKSLFEQRDVLEEQAKLYKDQPGMLKNTQAELTKVNQQIIDGRNSLREYAEVGLVTQKNEIAKQLAAAKATSAAAAANVLAAERNRVRQRSTYAYGPGQEAASAAGIALAKQAQQEALTAENAVNARMIAINARIDLLSGSEEERLSKLQLNYVSLTEELVAQEKAAREAKKAFDKMQPGEAADEALKKYTALTGVVTELKDTMKALRDESGDALYAVDSSADPNKRREMLDRMLDDQRDFDSKMKMSAEERADAELKTASESYSKLLAAQNTAIAKYEAAEKALAASKSPTPEDRINVAKLYAEAYDSAVNLKEAQVELDTATKAATRSEDQNAKALDRMTKTAAELTKAESELEKQLLDQAEAFRDLDYELMKHGSQYDDLKAKALQYARTVKQTRISGTQLAGDLGYGTPPASAVVTAATGNKAAAHNFVEKAAASVGLPLPIAKAVWDQESGSNFTNTRLKNTEGSGATGTWQMMPGTAKALGIRDIDSATFEQQALAGIRYLKEGYSKYGTAEGAFKYYYGGPDERQWGPRTRKYAAENMAKLGGNQYANATASSSAAEASSIAQTTLAMRDQSETVIKLTGDKGALNKVDAQTLEQVRKERDLTNQHVDSLKRVQLAQQNYAAALGDVYAMEQSRPAAGFDVAQANTYDTAVSKAQAARTALSAEQERAVEIEDKLIRSGEKLSERVTLSDEEWKSLSLQYDDAAAATEDYLATQDILGQLLDRNLISQETYNRSLEDAATNVASAKGGFAEFFDSLKYNSRDFEDIGVGVMQEFEDAIVSALENGKFEFEDFFSYIKQLAAKFAVDQVILAAFNPSFSANISGSGATGSASAGAKLSAGGTDYSSYLGGLKSLSTGTGTGTYVANTLDSLAGYFGYTGNASAGLVSQAGGYYVTLPSSSSLTYSPALSSAMQGMSAIPNYYGLVSGLGGGYLGSALYPNSPYAGIGGSVGATAGMYGGGALSNALLGATYGAAVPIVGPVVGAILGAVGGSWLASTLGGGGKEAIATMGIDSGRFAFSNANQEMGKSGQVSQINAAKDQANALLDALTDALGMEAFVARSGFSQSQPLTGDQIGSWLTERTSAIADTMINAQSGIAGDLIKETWTNSGKDINVLLQQVDVLKQIAAVLPQLTAYLQDSGMNLGSDPKGAALRLIKAAGGVQQFAGLRSQYFEAFGTEEEKLAAAHSALAAAFKDTGMTLPETREELVKLVKSLDITSETGLNSYVAILGLSDALDQLYTKSEDAAKAILEAAKATEAQKQSLTSILSGSLAADRLILSASGARFSDLSNARGVGATLSGSTKEQISQQIELFGGMDAILKALGKDSEEWISAIDSYYAAEERLAASRQSAVDTLNGAILTEKEFAKVKAAAAAQTANQIAMSIHGIDITKKTVEQYREWMKKAGGAGAVLEPLGDKAQQYSDAVAGYYSAMATAIKSTDAPVKDLTKSLDSFVDSLTDWVAKVRSEDAKLKSPDQSLAFQYSAYAAQAALAKQGNKKAAEGITTYADAYLEAAKLSSRDRTEYDRIVGLVTAEVAAIARRFGGKGYADGGIATGPSTGYSATLHGTEAVIPLENGNIPLDISFEELVEEIRKLRADVVAVGVQQIKHSVTSSKTLRKWDTLGMPVTQP